MARRDEQLGYETLLVTGDKDAYQLASDKTRIVTTKKGITDVAIYGPAEVAERYGVTPAQVPDFLGLKGDSSDNIPGVPGIGEKTAAKLLQQYGSLEGLYENLDALKGKQLERIRDNKDAAFASREVATIVCDLDFAARPGGGGLPLVRRGEGGGGVPEDPVQHPSGTRPQAGGQGVGEVAGAARRGSPSCMATRRLRSWKRPSRAGETVGVAFVEPEQVSLFSSGVIAAFCTSQGTAAFEEEEGLTVLARVVKSCPFAALDVKETLHRVYPADTAVPALVTDDDLMAMRAFDLGLAGYVLNSSVSEYSFDALLDAYCGGVLPDTKTDEERAVVCAAAARQLVEPLTQALERDGSTRAYFDIDLPLVAVLSIMERTGTALDCDRLAELGASTEDELAGLRERIFDMAGETFNLDSPKQLAHILFEVMGLTPLKKNQRGYSTDAAVLKELSKTHEMPALLLRYRELSKIKSTYIDALPRMRATDGRVHTCFNETVTTTGRLSSSDPNLQNIPVRTEFGRQIRECFTPLASGSKFLSADYSQIELRLLAHLSGDEHLVAAFCSGADFHASTASRVFDVPLEDVTPQLRSRAKAVNFGIVYGQQAFGLAQSLDIPFGEAKEMIDRYFEAYPGVRAYLDATVEEAKKTGYATTMFGRKRHVPELKAANAAQRGFGERTAMNHPMQGSAADIIKLAMKQVQQRLHDEGFEARLMLQVHDELDFSVPEGEIERLGGMVREVMENVVELRVPLEVDVSWGDNWAQAH